LKPSRLVSLIPLALAWLGYFSPWLWPVPAALRLSAYDLVEWMTFMQSVRDGTYPITRLDLLWPLAGIALLTALCSALNNKPQRREDREVTLNGLSVLRAFAANHWPNILAILFALFAACLILPAYPFILTAHTDPELRPQLMLGIATGVAALIAAGVSAVRPARALWLIPIIALLSLVTTVRAFAITRQPIADVLAHPAPIGYGFVLAVIGFGWLAIVPTTQFLTRLWRNGRMPQVQPRA
jgi:hypothetical protein